MKHYTLNGLTLYNAILSIARNFLETWENIKISTHPFYHFFAKISKIRPWVFQKKINYFIPMKISPNLRGRMYESNF